MKTKSMIKDGMDNNMVLRGGNKMLAVLALKTTVTSFKQPPPTRHCDRTTLRMACDKHSL